MNVPLPGRLHPTVTGPGFTFSSTAQDRRIDYVFVTRDTGVEGAYVPQTIGSDHLPVVTDVTLPGRGDDDDDD